MFDRDFYPTPEAVVSKMANKVNWNNIFHALEPSAGKGDILEFMKSKTHVSWEVVEKNEDLKAILYSKAYSVVGDDFLKYQTNTEYDLIMANPPFSEGEKHLIKMIELAENQVYKTCQIVCLLNAETIKNTFSNSRASLRVLLEKYNASIEYIDNAFVTAERKTNVEIALIDVTVNRIESTHAYFDSLLEKMANSKHESFGVSIPNNAVGYKEDEIMELITLYKEHIKRYKAYFKGLNELEVYNTYLSKRSDIKFYNSIYRKDLDYNAELESIRYRYWSVILKSEKFQGLLTTNAYRQLIKKIEGLSKLEINLENIFTMLVSLSQNKNTILTDSLVAMFDDIVKYHQAEFSKNLHYYNGWKTNKAFRLNKKVIIPVYGSVGFCRWRRSGYSDVDFQVKEKIDDILKTMSLVTIQDSGDWVQLSEYEFENNLIRFKVFKKGTLHIWFKDENALSKLNFIVGQHKKWLPSNEEIKRNKEASVYIKREFPDLNNQFLK